MTPELKKIIAGAVAAGSLVAGGMTAAQPDCDYTIQGECVSQEQVDAVMVSAYGWDSVQTWDNH